MFVSKKKYTLIICIRSVQLTRTLRAIFFFTVPKEIIAYTHKYNQLPSKARKQGESPMGSEKHLEQEHQQEQQQERLEQQQQHHHRRQQRQQRQRLPPWPFSLTEKAESGESQCLHGNLSSKS